jgi:hypothetical protein
MDQTAMDFNSQAAHSGSPMIVMIVQLAILILLVVSGWRIFSKAGEPGWACIIPIYGSMVAAKIAGKPMWWGLLTLIPLLGIIFAIIIVIGLAKNFGKGIGFGIGLILLGFIFAPILAFGDAKYSPQAA